MKKISIFLHFQSQYKMGLASLVAQMVDSACNVGDPIPSLGGENALEKDMATHSSILALRILCTVESMGPQRVGHH